MFKSIGNTVSDEEASMLLKTADYDSDNKLNINEFMDLILGTTGNG